MILLTRAAPCRGMDVVRYKCWCRMMMWTASVSLTGAGNGVGNIPWMVASPKAPLKSWIKWPEEKNTRSVVPKPARNSNFTKNSAQIEEAKNKKNHENLREYQCFLQNAGELRCKIMLWSMKNVTQPRIFEHLVHVHMPKKVILLARFPTRRDDYP